MGEITYRVELPDMEQITLIYLENGEDYCKCVLRWLATVPPCVPYLIPTRRASERARVGGVRGSLSREPLHLLQNHPICIVTTSRANAPMSSYCAYPKACVPVTYVLTQGYSFQYTVVLHLFDFRGSYT